MAEEVGAQILEQLREIVARVRRIAELLRTLESHLDLMASSPPWYKE